MQLDDNQKLVDARGLLEALFHPNSRPSLRWLRQLQAENKVPYYKIGNLVWFNVTEAQKAIRKLRRGK